MFHHYNTEYRHSAYTFDVITFVHVATGFTFESKFCIVLGLFDSLDVVFDCGARFIPMCGLFSSYSFFFSLSLFHHIRMFNQFISLLDLIGSSYAVVLALHSLRSAFITSKNKSPITLALLKKQQKRDYVSIIFIAPYSWDPLFNW